MTILKQLWYKQLSDQSKSQQGRPLMRQKILLKHYITLNYYQLYTLDNKHLNNWKTNKQTKKQVESLPFTSKLGLPIFIFKNHPRNKSKWHLKFTNTSLSEITLSLRPIRTLISSSRCYYWERKMSLKTQRLFKRKKM